MRPWEIHPVLVHFPIAFLLAAAIAQLWVSRYPQSPLHQVARTIASWGVALGWVAACAGVVAWLTLPTHTEAVHTLMFLHGGLALGGLIACTAGVLFGRRQRSAPALWLGLAGATLIAAAGFVGGSMVYRGGAGISPDRAELAPEGHHHSHSH